MKDILSDIDTLSLGNGFCINKNKLYFFTPEELSKKINEAIEKLEKIIYER